MPDLRKTKGGDYYKRIASLPRKKGSKTGFASMDIKLVKELGARGGKKKVNTAEQAKRPSRQSVQPVDKGQGHS